MLTKSVKVLIAVFLLLILTGCSPGASKKSIINKKSPPVKASYGDNYEIVQLDNGTVIFRDRKYPGLD